MTPRTAQLVLALAFLLGALFPGRTLRRSGLAALCLTAAGMTLLPELAAPHGAPGAVARVLGMTVAALLLAVALLLLLDGAVLLWQQGIAGPPVGTMAAGLLLAAAVAVAAAGTVGALPAAPAVVLGAPAFCLTVFFLLFLRQTMTRGRLWPRRPAGYVVVLGAALAGGEVSPLLGDRLDRALAAYLHLRSRGGDPTVVVSGGQGADEELPEAEAMYRYLLAHGLPAHRMLRESRSRSTEENLANTAALIDTLIDTRGASADLLVVTSDFHVVRTALIMERLGLRGSVVGARTRLAYWPTAALREFVAVLWYDRRAAACLGALLVLPCAALLLPG
ncbi:YdcF family protein [Streptacidiphilus rugosus]|uniref:YdcF family protein n=1 Tax=Streptacidiphilus rugosus TaxID=405783 RepID=UPI0006912350|nr:YdcF family protein [Streptacidiphilus rugosus]